MQQIIGNGRAQGYAHLQVLQRKLAFAALVNEEMKRRVLSYTNNEMARQLVASGPVTVCDTAAALGIPNPSRAAQWPDSPASWRRGLRSELL